MIRSILVSLATLLALCLPVAGRAAPISSASVSRAPVSHAETAVHAQLASLPLGFEPNRGQTAPAVRFLAHGAGYTAFLTDHNITLALAASGPRGRAGVLRLTPAGARMSRPVATSRLTGTVSYFLGRSPAAWHSRIPRFAEATYDDLYPDIDLAVHGRQDRLEYDWVVQPGADPAAIHLALSGASHQRLDAHGTLILRTAAGDLRQSPPEAYQVVNGHRRVISSRTILRGGKMGFQIGSYNHRLPLIIDPILTYSDYLGGSGNDAANGIAVDSSGDAYVTGYTASTDFPVTTGAYQVINHGSTDAFLTVLNAAGTDILYSSYLGGSAQDVGQSVALDGADDGDAYLTGYTYSSDFPTSNSALQKTAPSGEKYHAFVTVLNTAAATTAGQLAYSTYLGGGSAPATGTAAYGIAADSGHNAYVTGLTFAQGLPTLHPFQHAQTTNGAYPNAFLIRLATTQSGAASLVYGTYYGAVSSSGTGAYGITTDGTGMAAITGFVQGAGLPTRNPYQSTYGGGMNDAFVADFDTNNTMGGASLVFATYLGGNGNDIGHGIITDGSGDYYLTGSSSSTNFPQTDTANPVVPPANRGGLSDVFITKLVYTPSSAHLAIGYSILIGGTAEDVGTSIGIDPYADAYVTGYTASADFPSVNPLTGQDTYQGGAYDAFVAEVSPQGNALLYSTFLGGSGDDRGLGIAVRGVDAFVDGSTTSPNFPSTGAISPAANKGTICPGQATPCSDGFVARLSQGVAPAEAGTVKGSGLCTLHTHTTGTPSCSITPAVNCGPYPTCQLSIKVNAACSIPPITVTCGTLGGRLGAQGFSGRWTSGTTSGTSTDGGSATLQGVGFYSPLRGPGPNASFQLTGQDSDTGVPAADTDTITLTISPINGATFPTTTAHWTCAPPTPPCSLEITLP